MIPAHKIARAPPPALAELNLFLHSIHDFNDLAGKGTAFPQDDPRAENGLPIDAQASLPRLRDAIHTRAASLSGCGGAGMLICRRWGRAADVPQITWRDHAISGFNQTRRDLN
jgi:hypothetical protein